MVNSLPRMLSVLQSLHLLLRRGGRWPFVSAYWILSPLYPLNVPGCRGDCFVAFTAPLWPVGHLCLGIDDSLVHSQFMLSLFLVGSPST